MKPADKENQSIQPIKSLNTVNEVVPKAGWTSFSVALRLQGSIWVPTESATCVMSPVCSAAVQRQRTAPAALKHGEDSMSCQKLQSSTAEQVYFQFSNPRGSKVNVGLHMAIPQSTWPKTLRVLWLSGSIAACSSASVIQHTLQTQNN